MTVGVCRLMTVKNRTKNLVISFYAVPACDRQTDTLPNIISEAKTSENENDDEN